MPRSRHLDVRIYSILGCHEAYYFRILKWLILEGYEVVAYLANVGQEENWAEVEKKALALGAERMIIDDLQEEFVEKLVHRAIQCNAVYEDRCM